MSAAPGWAERLKIATFHTELSREGPGLLLNAVLSGDDPQVEAVVAVLAAADADAVLLLDIDWDLGGVTLDALADRAGYPYRLALRPNRGMASGFDLDGDGRIGGPGDAQGWGDFAGQGGMAILSRLPVAAEEVRDFTGMAWIALPGHHAPPGTPEVQRLSTTGHWDVPLILSDGTHLHLLAWHATPPAFEARNIARNRDEALFWTGYLDGDFGPPPAKFVLLGDANADPERGAGETDALAALLTRTDLTDPEGTRDITADWGDLGPGALRVDYVLPSATLAVTGAGIHWPDEGTAAGLAARAASRHRLVWAEVETRP